MKKSNRNAILINRKVRRITSVKHLVFALAGFILLTLSSCRTARVIPRTITVARPISTGKLIRNIDNNAFDYKHLSIKKISCQFDNGKTKASFKASILAEKDKRITVLLSKLNIPVARIWLTPDSVKLINYLEDTYLLDDYSYLSSLMGIDLDFETIHAIISNNMFSLRDDKHDKENYDYMTKIDSGLYVLESVKKLKIRKATQRVSARKTAKNLKKSTVDAPVLQTIFIDPETYKIRKIRMDDSANSRKLNIDFSDFVPVDKQTYPGDIFLHLVSPDSEVQLRIKLNGFSTSDEKEVRFRVPENFTRINTK